MRCVRMRFSLLLQTVHTPSRRALARSRSLVQYTQTHYIGIFLPVHILDECSPAPAWSARALNRLFYRFMSRFMCNVMYKPDWRGIKLVVFPLTHIYIYPADFARYICSQLSAG